MSETPCDGATILAQTARIVGPLIRSRVNGLPPEIRRVAGVHFGWQTEDHAAVRAGVDGKALRPALCLLACRAVGGAAEEAHPAAVAVELVHNASLLHDDIIDQDTLRRGRPALWAVKGLPAALLAGDALFFAAVHALTDTDRSASTIPVLLGSVQALIEGEYLDTLLEAEAEVSEERAVAVAAAKTGELFACACELGALAGGADPARARHLRAFGQHLGIAFQCLDDILGIWGEEQLTGKPARSDLRARTITVPVAAALAARTPQAAALHALYQQDAPMSEEDCRQAAQLIEETGARETTLRRARRCSTEALEHLALAEPDPVLAAELGALANMIVDPDR
ncbi:polyprenyl synthetase family protein [Streptomyces sp. NPDC032472]|uniref:polyprenyl synthetase family protein n=1 Tax=Streptomyces sp. NPDC032472 TaxID=3155018 RepID=UPI0033CD3E24